MGNCETDIVLWDETSPALTIAKKFKYAKKLGFTPGSDLPIFPYSSHEAILQMYTYV